MGLPDKLFNFVDEVLHGLNDWFAQPANHYCKLETRANKSTLIADDGSLITLIECHGNLQMYGAEEHSKMIESLVNSVSSKFVATGHAIQVVMTYNPEGASQEIREALKPSRITAKNLGLDIDTIMDDWVESVASYCAVEHVYLVAWTRPFVLPAAEQKIAAKQMGKDAAKAPFGKNIQNVGMIMHNILDVHSGFVGQITSALSFGGMATDVMDAHSALWVVRHQIDPNFTRKTWRALLPGDKLPLMGPEKNASEEDISSLFYPSLKKQIFPREAEMIDRKTIRVGDHIHAPISMILPPQNPMPFNVLFRTLITKKLPFRVSFLFDGDGLNALTFKGILAAVLSFTSSTNKMFNRTLDDLRQQELDGETFVRFQASFDTWVEDDKTPECLRLLQSRVAELASAIQSWGTSDCGEVVGDPLLGLAATIPALMPKSPAPVSVGPLTDILYMMPFTRPASPWRDGSIPLRTPDGKIMLYSQGSSKQAAWIDAGFAPMGSGKSVWLNTMNWGFLTQPGLSRLPWLSIIDVGPSSSGLISLVQSILPKDKKYLAAYHRLRPEKSYSINPFDTPLGCRKPFPAHESFLTNLLTLFATPLDADAPQDGVAGISKEVVRMAYDECSDDRNPKIYAPGIDKVVDKLLYDLGYHIDATTAWWDIVDYLFEQGYTHEASRAQRYAVPLLRDISGMAKRERVTSSYKFTTPSGEEITEFFARMCREAISAYAILGDPTQFDLGDAQIVSLDLDEVAPRGGPKEDRETGVMYMLARHVVASRFFMMPQDIVFVPELYKRYHKERIENIRQDPKRLCYDELHRVVRSSSVSGQLIGDLETSSRESRKWNLHIGLYSQTMSDIPDVILELATAIFILGAGTAKSVTDVVERLGLNQTAHNAITKLRKPGKQGASMVAMFKTGDGTAVQLLTNTVGMRALWAFSSTTEDVHLRNFLYEKIGVGKTLRLLSKLYPGGVKSEVERRKAGIAELDETEQIKDITKEIGKEILEIAGKEFSED